MTDCKSEHKKGTATAKNTSTTVATIFFNSWISCYGIPAKALRGNDPQLASRCFKTVCVELGIVQLTTTDYRPQSSGQAEGFDVTTSPNINGTGTLL